MSVQKDDCTGDRILLAAKDASGTFLKEAGVHPKLIQTHMRHSTITLTMDRYTHESLNDEDLVISATPETEWPANKTATSQKSLSAGLSPDSRFGQILLDVDGQDVSSHCEAPRESKSSRSNCKTRNLPEKAHPFTITFSSRRSGRVVECAGLENR